MKKVIAAVLFLGVAAGVSFAAEDPLKAALDMYKLLFENDRVRVMEVTFKPGQKIAKHTHPSDHAVYVAEAGQLTISKDGAAPSVADLAVGQVLWIPAETHSAQNTGKTQVRLVVSELKGASAPAPMATTTPAKK